MTFGAMPCEKHSPANIVYTSAIRTNDINSKFIILEMFCEKMKKQDNMLKNKYV